VLEFEDGTLLEASTEGYIRDGLLQWPEVSYTAFTCFLGFTVFFCVYCLLELLAYPMTAGHGHFTWRIAHFDRIIFRVCESGPVRAELSSR